MAIREIKKARSVDERAMRVTFAEVKTRVKSAFRPWGGMQPEGLRVRERVGTFSETSLGFEHGGRSAMLGVRCVLLFDARALCARDG